MRADLLHLRVRENLQKEHHRRGRQHYDRRFIASFQSLIDTNNVPIDRMFAQLSSAEDALDALAKRTEKLVRDNGTNLDSGATDEKVALSEFKAAPFPLTPC